MEDVFGSRVWHRRLPVMVTSRKVCPASSVLSLLFVRILGPNAPSSRMQHLLLIDGLRTSEHVWALRK
jgi:hypothetical protein